jgi:hypothetical protein
MRRLGLAVLAGVLLCSAVAEGRIVRRARRRNVQDIAEIVEMRENIFDVNGSPALGPNVIEILRRDIDSLGIKAGPINVSGQPTANKLVRGHDLLTRGGRIYTAWTEQDTQTGSVKLRLGGIGQDGGVRRRFWVPAGTTPRWLGSGG